MCEQSCPVLARLIWRVCLLSMPFFPVVVYRCFFFLLRWEQALAALLRALSVPDMPMQVQLERSIEAAVLCEGMGLKVGNPSSMGLCKAQTQGCVLLPIVPHSPLLGVDVFVYGTHLTHAEWN